MYNKHQLVLSLDTTPEPIRAARDSLKRVEAFEGYPDAYDMAVCGREMIEKVTNKLLQMLSTRHIKAGLKTAIAQMRTYEPPAAAAQTRAKLGAGGYIHVAAQTKSRKLRASGGGGAGGGERGAGRKEQQANTTSARNIAEKKQAQASQLLKTTAQRRARRMGTAKKRGAKGREGHVTGHADKDLPVS